MRDDRALWEDNGKRIRIHTGRLHIQDNEDPPDDDTWGNWITLAEHLLIHAHLPAWNSIFIVGAPNGEVGGINYRDVHVLNWGQYGLLLPEVSGARHTCEDDSVFNRLNEDPRELRGES